MEAKPPFQYAQINLYPRFTTFVSMPVNPLEIPMQKALFTIALAWLSYLFANAQTTPLLGSLRIEALYASLGNVVDPGVGYSIRYSRHVAGSRFLLGGTMGYISAPGTNASFRDYHSIGRKSERIIADFTAFYDFLPSPRQALRLGGGPSLWHRRDDLYQGMVIHLASPQSDKVIKVDFLRQDVEETNIGLHVMAEYERSITAGVHLAGRVGFAQFSRSTTGFNPLAGLGLGYRF